MHASSTMPRGVGDTKLTSLFAVEADPRKWNTVEPPAGWTKDSFLSFLREYPNYVEWRTKELGWIPYPILGLAVPAAVALGLDPAAAGAFAAVVAGLSFEQLARLWGAAALVVHAMPPELHPDVASHATPDQA